MSHSVSQVLFKIEMDDFYQNLLDNYDFQPY
jgi:hypothetical protein